MDLLVMKGCVLLIIRYWADSIEAVQPLVAGLVIEHGHSSSLHDTVLSQLNLNGLKHAEVHQASGQGHLVVSTAVPLASGARGVQLKQS